MLCIKYGKRWTVQRRNVMCEKCLYRKNCQFLASRKNSVKTGEVTGCTAFESDDRYQLSEEARIQLKEIADALEFQLLVR